MSQEKGPDLRDIQEKEIKDTISNQHMEKIADKVNMPEMIVKVAAGAMKDEAKEKMGNVKNKIKGLFRQDKKE